MNTTTNPSATGIVVSGMRPTGRLHIGRWLGALRNWIRLQHERRCFFFIADWHVLTTRQDGTGDIERNVRDMMIDFLSAGLDPEKAVIFRQSAVKEHAELHLLFSMIVPTPWLIRNPTVKEQARELGLVQAEDEEAMTTLNYGLLGYPVLQAADILMYKATGVPVGIDQVPHVELTREIARRFNHLYRPVFPEPDALLTEAQKVPGTDGRKMGTSYNNAVFLSDPPEVIDQKLGRMMTDPRRVRRTDPGEPFDCPAFNLHRIYCTPDEIESVTTGCRTAGIGCLDCKRVMIKHVVAELGPMSERRAALEAQPEMVQHALEHGNAQARKVAATTMEGVRQAMGLGA
jgi:tryptophanyl-tRNA synthetase